MWGKSSYSRGYYKSDDEWWRCYRCGSDTHQVAQCPYEKKGWSRHDWSSHDWWNNTERTVQSSVEHCVSCETGVIDSIAESRNWQLCRRCWRDQGSHFKAASYECNEPGCLKQTFRLRGPAYRRGVCEGCYRELRTQTLRQLMQSYGNEPPGWSESWDARVVFLGNLDYEAIKSEVANWVKQLAFAHIDPKLPLFDVRCENGGHQGDHGGAKKTLKRFAFLRFEFARDAITLLDKFGEEEQTFQSRRIVAFPSVIAGSWIWLRKKWYRCQNYIPVDEQPPTVFQY